MSTEIVGVSNWWPWCSKASVISALRAGYRFHLIVSDTQNDPPAEPFVEAMKGQFPGRIESSRDPMPRPGPPEHMFTRYDYLPELLEHYQLPILVTDADLIHRRVIRVPEGTDAGLCFQGPNPESYIDFYGPQQGLPLVWGEFVVWLLAGVTYFGATEAGREFARRIKRYIDDLRANGLGNKWGGDQLAVFAATKRLHGAQVHRFNQHGCEDVCGTVEHPDHAVWMPSVQKRDPESNWMKALEKLSRGLIGGPVDF